MEFDGYIRQILHVFSSEDINFHHNFGHDFFFFSYFIVEHVKKHSRIGKDSGNGTRIHTSCLVVWYCAMMTSCVPRKGSQREKGRRRRKERKERERETEIRREGERKGA